MQLYDSHCHLSPEIDALVFENDVVPLLRRQTWPLNLMSTNVFDIELICQLAENAEIHENSNILLNLGVHPWFSHLFTLEENIAKSDHYGKVLVPYNKKAETAEQFEELLAVLPDPVPIHEMMNKFKDKLVKYGDKFNIGEIGIDKLARIPMSGYLGNPNCKKVGLSNYRISMDHQKAIFEMQLGLYEIRALNFSIHCVGAHGLLYDVLSKLEKTNCRFIMHSYSGSVDSAKMLHSLRNVEVWFGISYYVNISHNKVLNDDGLKHRILVETDLGIDRMKEDHVNELHKSLKGLDDVGISATVLFDNWKRFSGC